MPDPTPTHDRVPFKEKAALGVGALAAFFGYAGVSILAYPVYNMVLGVSASWIGVALMIPRIWDGLIDPIAGRISDNCRSRFGRRKPFIVVGALGMGLLFGLLWSVPPGWSDTMKMVFFVAMQLLFFTAYAFFAVPYGALTYEMSPDYHERTRVMAAIAFFHKLGELASGWMLPLAGMLSAALVVGAADLNTTGVRAMGWLIGIVAMACLGVIPGLFVRERFAHKAEQQSQVGVWEGIRGAMQSRAFLTLLAIIVLNTLSGVLASGIDQYVLVYFMNGGDKAMGLLQKGLLTSGYGVVGFAAIPLITWLGGRYGKSGSLYFVYGLMVIGGIAKWFIFTPGHPVVHLGKVAIDPVILLDPLLCGPMWVAVKIMLASMMADICDEDELKHGVRREGMFGGVFAWLEKMVLSLAYLGTGLALSLAHFDPNLGGAQPAGTFTRMRVFLAGAPALTAMFALIALRFYPIDAARAANTRRQLEARRGAVRADEPEALPA